MSADGQTGRNLRTLPQEHANRPLTAFARDYQDGEDTGWHHHARAQLLYAIQGVMRVATRAVRYTVPPGRALWVPAAMPHRVHVEGPLAMRALFFRADAAVLGAGGALVLAVSPLLRELILAACAEPLEWDEAGRGGHLAALIAEEVARAPHLPLGLPAPHDARLLRVADALVAKPDLDWTLEEWAGRCGASARTLARLFRAETGMGFARWRQTLRLTEAAALLARGVAPAEAAARVGYASAPAFGASFRAAFGVTPGEAQGKGQGEGRPIPSASSP